MHSPKNPLLLGHVAHINLDRELFRQKIKQVDIHIECPGSDRKPEPGYGQIECLLVRRQPCIVLRPVRPLHYPILGHLSAMLSDLDALS
jgi:hypothetical protein